MKICYCTWHENAENDLTESLLRAGHVVVNKYIPINNINDDSLFDREVEHLFLEENCEVFFSFNYLPNIARIAEKMRRKYIAWVFDMPHMPLYSPIISSEYSYIFIFDYFLFLEIKKLKQMHVYHMPLAVNSNRLNQQLGLLNSDISYEHEVSFIGSMYDNNFYDQIIYLPDYIKGYLEGIMLAQSRIYGYNMIAELLEDSTWAIIDRLVSIETNEYMLTRKQVFVDMLNKKLTSMERIQMMRTLGAIFDVSVFTTAAQSLIPEAKHKGIVSFDKEMPYVFRKSKINLNITLRSILSGIPLRVFDVLGAGGFLITNYQPEIAETFIDGEELVIFESEEDLIKKVEYYLKHDDERKEIAFRGWKKVQEKFNYDIQLEKIFTLAFNE